MFEGLRMQASAFHATISQTPLPNPPPPFFSLFHFPTAAFLTRVIVKCSSLVGEYKPSYAARIVKYVLTLEEKVRISAQARYPLSISSQTANCYKAQATISSAPFSERCGSAQVRG